MLKSEIWSVLGGIFQVATGGHKVNPKTDKPGTGRKTRVGSQELGAELGFTMPCTNCIHRKTILYIYIYRFHLNSSDTSNVTRVHSSLDLGSPTTGSCCQGPHPFRSCSDVLSRSFSIPGNRLPPSGRRELCQSSAAAARDHPVPRMGKSRKNPPGRNCGGKPHLRVAFFCSRAVGRGWRTNLCERGWRNRRLEGLPHGSWQFPQRSKRVHGTRPFVQD